MKIAYMIKPKGNLRERVRQPQAHNRLEKVYHARIQPMEPYIDNFGTGFCKMDRA